MHGQGLESDAVLHTFVGNFPLWLPDQKDQGLYRVSSAFARPSTGGQMPAGDRPAVDARFDVQVRQSLPFMNFSTAHWEMLVAVRNFFRDTTVDQSLYDELLVVRPPKRIVGGLTLRF